MVWIGMTLVDCFGAAFLIVPLAWTDQGVMELAQGAGVGERV